jgi:hypothetical protein
MKKYVIEVSENGREWEPLFETDERPVIHANRFWKLTRFWRAKQRKGNTNQYQIYSVSDEA